MSDSETREFRLEFLPVWLNQYGTIREDNCWDALITVVDIHHKGRGFRVSFQAHWQIGDVVRIKKCLYTTTIRAAFSGIHNNLCRSECVEVVHEEGFLEIGEYFGTL